MIMKKIPTIFKRNPDNMKELLREPNPEADWVFAGEGVATRKYDGTCCLVKDGVYYKRREIKPGQELPQDFMLADTDAITGKRVGWVPVDTTGREDCWHMDAWHPGLKDGTYELIGPRVQGNPERVSTHLLIVHANTEKYPEVPRSCEGIKGWLSTMNIEGLVFHHQDGRMAKIKKRDFGMERSRN
jgi:hypothetical protein